FVAQIDPPHRGPLGQLIVGRFQADVALRELVADVLIRTDPPGARITVDGADKGASPVMVRNLALVMGHSVVATLAGYEVLHGGVRLSAARKDETVTFVLVPSRVNLALTSDPQGAAITMDGVGRGTTRFNLAGVQYGKHRFTAELAGYSLLDTTVDVSGGTGGIYFPLTKEPGGELEIKGDRPADFYVDGTLVNPGGQLENSGIQLAAVGTHVVKIQFASGPEIVKT